MDKTKFLPLLYTNYIGFGLLLHFDIKRISMLVFLLKELLLGFIAYLEGTQNIFQITALTWQASVPSQHPVDLNDVPNT